MSEPAPLCLYQGVVPPEWIDYNGHMNVASYVLAFDQATDALLDHLGMDQSYRERTRCSAFVVETHVNFQRELVAHDAIHITTQLLGFDSKRIHYFQWLYHSGQGFTAATSELMLIHVDMTERRSTALPISIMDRLSAIMTQHMQLPRPPQSGRVMGIRSRPSGG